MHCEVAEALSDKRPKEAPGAPGPVRGPAGLGAHMAFRIAVSGGGCGDGNPRDLLPRLPVPPPRAHDLLRPRSPRDYGVSKAGSGKGESQLTSVLTAGMLRSGLRYWRLCHRLCRDSRTSWNFLKSSLVSQYLCS